MKDDSIEVIEMGPVVDKSGKFLHYRLKIHYSSGKIRYLKEKNYLSAFRKSNDLLGFPKIEC